MKTFTLDQIKKEQQATKLFTAPVSMQSLVGPELSKHFMIRQVNFDPGVRNKFHSHSIDQVLIVTEGKGIVATDQEEVIVRPGDVVFIPAGEKHWHGATPDSTFSHLYVMSPDSKTTQLED
ncbi:hypothetical protein ANRL3_00467 [Anaerolineae bacterium]|nr:hypothetical protein ANRL3_00467 [Anaerolineae bacterium]